MNTQLMNTKLHPEINSSSEIKKESAVEKLKHERDINSNKGNTKVASI